MSEFRPLHVTPVARVLYHCLVRALIVTVFFLHFLRGKEKIGRPVAHVHAGVIILQLSCYRRTA